MCPDGFLLICRAAALCFLARTVPESKLLLLARLASDSGMTDSTSSTGRGLRACATANGPARAGRKGTATLASTKLESTDTGRTFSCILALFILEVPPNTRLWTQLYSLRHVWNEVDPGVEDKSWR